jgi:hypothetical protein
VTSPAGSTFEAITGTGTPELWVVGVSMVGGLSEIAIANQLCPGAVTDAGFTLSSMSVRQGNPGAWTFPESNSNDHTVEDISALHLFSSGPRPPGTSFTAVIQAASTLTVKDSATNSTSKVTVAIRLSKAKVIGNAPVTVTWAHSATAGYVEDVQVHRPQGGGYVDWITSSPNVEAQFAPDAGPGKYTFRARLRDSTTGKTTGWSPIATLTVTT